MPLHRRTLLQLAAGAATSGVAPLAVRGADFPDRPIRWIVAYPAGGGSDFLARQLAPAMGKILGTSVVIDNRPGAAGIIGTDAAARAAGDGYTVLTGDNGAMVFHTALYKKLPYDPKDFVPLGFMASFPLVLAVNPSAGFASLRELIDIVKKNPGKYSYASPGPGSPHHLAMELFKQRTGTFIVHVPYRGTAPALQDVVGGQVPMIVVDTAAGLPLIRAGKIKALGAMAKHRLAQLPDAPTMSEAASDRGLKDFEANAWQGLFAPKGTPFDIADKLSRAMRQAIASPEVRPRLEEFGLEVSPSDGPALASFIQSETVFWHKLIAERHLSIE